VAAHPYDIKSEKTGKAAFTLVEVMIVVVIIGLLAAIAIPNFIKARVVSRRKACGANLKLIHSAINTWALETQRTTGDPVVISDLYGNTNYIKGIPRCPAGGSYVYYDVGDPVQVECTLAVLHGHTIP
jgi:prepilin-type N-terminal cleavage/methylation domain-containing protein